MVGNLRQIRTKAGHLQFHFVLLNATLLDEIEHFFVSYNAQKGKKFLRAYRDQTAGFKLLFPIDRETQS